MQKSLANLIGITKKRIRPIFNKYITQSIALWSSGTVVFSLLSIALLFTKMDSQSMQLLIDLGGFGFFLIALLHVIILGHQLSDILSFYRDKEFGTLFTRDAEKFKLTQEEVQTLVDAGLNPQQEEHMIRAIKREGSLNYMNLIAIKELAKEFSEYQEKTISSDKNLELFCREHNIELDKLISEDKEKEVEMEWGETKPLKNYL